MRTADQLLSVVQAASELGMPPRTLHYQISTGKIAATKVGDGLTSAYVITRGEVDRIKAERELEATAWHPGGAR